MGDALRPGDDKFSRVLKESLKTWASYLATENKQHLLPRQAINMRPLVSQTPPFLGDGIASSDETTSFACEEKESTQEKGSLVVNGRSIWRTSDGICDLQPKVLPKKLLLAVGSRLHVELSEDFLSDYPGVQGLSGYDKGNYLSVLYFAWAYIISTRWVELLGRSADHECNMGYTLDRMDGPLPQSGNQPMVEIDIGDDPCEEEVLWWRAILCSNDGWDATAKYNGNDLLGNKSEAPLSGAALNYLSRFCVHHRLCAQCSVALAGVLYIPFLRGRTVSLPLLRQASRLEPTQCVGGSPVSIPDLLFERNELLPKYMTLSPNTWVIECNLVNAWLNPAFAIIDSISHRKNELAAFLANRIPLLGTLWLGEILTDLAKTILRDIQAGMTALDLSGSAWATTTQTFMTCNMGTSNGESIRRDDECRLLFITACEGRDRPPIRPWKPFGDTQLCDTDLTNTNLGNGYWRIAVQFRISRKIILRPLTKQRIPLSPTSHILTALNDYNYDFSSQSLSEVATRGIFEWLRLTGYPRCEKSLYQHSWIDLEGTDEEEEPDDAESDAEKYWSHPKKTHVESWLDGIE
ncbi:hypothetical protein N7463_007907 [Penicillium fimorum]|uniref:Uncharacterized protein n=1 Tax=Penicillium fimorum TaxID=1882269 RepID=A0A9W9XX99_9EURO|nr:hypothetical protein N7463_007907 [Penicillium fimorum]